MDSTRGTMVLPDEEGRNEEDIGQGEPALGATAEKGRGEIELKGEGPAAGLVDENMNKEGGGATGGQKNEQQLKELIPQLAEGESVQSMARQVPRRRLRHRFTQWQLDELESIFKANCFLSIEARKQLARWMGVTEAIVKRWFQKRREHYRRYKRL